MADMIVNMTTDKIALTAVTGSYYAYAALYFEGYYCCAKRKLPVVYRA